MVLPERNRGDLDDVPQEVRDAMTFHFAMTVDEVLAVALEPAPGRAGRLTDSLLPATKQRAGPVAYGARPLPGRFAPARRW